MRKQISELQVVNPPQLPLTNDTQSFVRQSLIKGGSWLLSENVDYPTFFEKVFSLFTFHFSPKRSAFTLAEALITLGIIGVVAVLTLPTLIQNYQKQVYVNQLRKAYSTVSQAFKKAMADEGVTNTKEMNSFIKTEGNQYVYDMEEMKKYLHIVQVGGLYNFYTTSYKTLNGNSAAVPDEVFMELTNGHLPIGRENTVILSDGTIIYFSSLGTISNSIITSIGIDVNGFKGPNQSGRDLFFFVISENGDLYPFGSPMIEFEQSNRGYGQLIKDNDYISSYVSEDSDLACDPSLTSTFGLGAYCAYRIIKNGWVMDY